MTSFLFQDFNERTQEVSQYFLFLKNLEQQTIKISMEDKEGKIKTKTINSELLKTLKASAFLLLYNLAESTMRDAIEAIFAEIRSKRISFDDVRPELKIIILQNLNKRKPDKILLKIASISLDIVTVSFNKEDLFSGNIDSRLIRKTAEKYGFSSDTDYHKTGQGEDLLKVKTHRNDLAHGIKSFGEVGREQTADELIQIKNKVIKYLRQILQNIEDYMTNQEYLDSSQSSS